jgi:hypothetical protein
MSFIIRLDCINKRLISPYGGNLYKYMYVENEIQNLNLVLF